MSDNTFETEKRLTILETSVNQITKDIGDLATIVKEQNIALTHFNEHTNKNLEVLAKEISESKIPNWQTLLMYIGTILSVGILITSIMYNSISATNNVIEATKNENQLYRQIIDLELRNDILSGAIKPITAP